MDNVFKINKIAKSVAAFAVIGSVLIWGTGPAQAGASINAGGIECMSNNLSQAINAPIIWDGFRIRNDSPSAQRFVLCPIPNAIDIDDTGTAQSMDGGSVWITAWFGPNAATNAEVACTVRTIPVGDSGTPTTGLSFSVVMTAGGSVPSTDQSVTSTPDGGNGILDYLVPVIASCRLDPGTGIQQLGSSNG
jgi:hypothetical protein